MQQFQGSALRDLLLLTAMIAMLVGCGAKIENKTGNPVDRKSTPLRATDIVGTWRCPAEKGKWKETEWGPARFEWTFNQDGTFEHAFTIDPMSPPGGGTVKSTGKYKVTGDTLVLDDRDRSDPLKISWANGRLILQSKNGERLAFAKVR